MKRIDFMGLPGSGKSTLYNALLKERRHGENWLAFAEAKKKAIGLYILQTGQKSGLKSKIISDVKARLITSDFFNRQINLVKYFISSRQDQIYLRFADENDAFIKACAGSFKECIDIGTLSSRRFFLSAKWSVQKFSEIQLLQEMLDKEEIVIFEESLCHKVFEMVNFDYSPLTDLQLRHVENIYLTLPLPHAVVFCNEDSALIEKRLLLRPRLRQSEMLIYGGQSIRRWIADARIMVEAGKGILKKRGVNLLELPEGEYIDTKINMLKLFLKDQL